MAVSNVQTASLGGPLQVTYGDWTSTEADTTTTLGVKGGRIYLALFSSQDSSGAMMMHDPRVSVSTTGAVTTMTIYAMEGVTTGRFLVVHA